MKWGGERLGLIQSYFLLVPIRHSQYEFICHSEYEFICHSQYEFIRHSGYVRGSFVILTFWYELIRASFV